MLAEKKSGKLKDVIIIDVRTPQEVLKTGVLPFAIHIPFAELDRVFTQGDSRFFQKMYGIPKPDPETADLVFYCHAGSRSHGAMHVMQSLGYFNVGHYPGGIGEWDGETLPYSSAGGNAAPKGGAEPKK